MKKNTSAVVYACIAVFSWSTVATAFKIALLHLSHFEMLQIASCTALFLFIVILTIQKKWRLVTSLLISQWLYFALIGFLNPVAYYLILFKSYDLLPAQVVQPINYLWPIFLLILLAVFAHQPIPGRKYVGISVSLVGVILISLGTSQSGKESSSFYGLVLAFLSALCWAIYWMIDNRQKEKIDGSVALFASFLFGTTYLFIASFWMGSSVFTMAGILSGMYIGGFEIGIPFICFGLAMRKTSNPALINQLCYLSPFLSFFFISIILGEQIVLTTYIGLCLIVLGILFNQLKKHNSEKIRENRQIE